MSTTELIETIRTLPAPSLKRVERLVSELASEATAKRKRREHPFFVEAEAVRKRIKSRYGVVRGAVKRIRELREGNT